MNLSENFIEECGFYEGYSEKRFSIIIFASIISIFGFFANIVGFFIQIIFLIVFALKMDNNFSLSYTNLS